MNTYAILLVIFTVAVTVSSEDHCIWYKVCYTNEDDGNSFNCPYNGTGVVLKNKKAQDIMLNRCSHFYKDSKFRILISQLTLNDYFFE